MNNREMWKWTRRVILAELIFLLFSVIVSMQHMPEIEGLEDQNPATNLGTYTSVSDPAEMLNDWDYDCATMSFNGTAYLNDYDFAIPSDYRIEGIRVTAYVAAPSGSTSLYLAIGKDETTTSSLVIDTMTTYGLACSTSYLKAFIAGGPTDLWGLSWTPAEINSANFTAYIENTLSGSSIYIDAIYVKVWYYPHTDSGTFNMLDSPISLTASPGYAWTTVDASSYVPADATGVIIAFSQVAAGNNRYKVRMYGSTDDVDGTLYSGYQEYALLIVGLDTSHRFQFASDCVGVSGKVELIGWTGPGVVFRANIANVSPSQAAWTDVDITSYLVSPTDDPLGAILWHKHVNSAGGSLATWKVRKDGSADDAINYVSRYGLWTMTVGVDSNIFEQAAPTNAPVTYSDQRTYLVGYVVEGPEFEDSPISLPGCSATNTTCDLSSYVPSITKTALIWFLNTGGGYSTFEISKNYTSYKTGDNTFAGGRSWYYAGVWPVAVNSSDLTFWIHTRNANTGIPLLLNYATETYTTTTTTTPGGTTTTLTGGGFNLPNVPDAIGDALGIDATAGGLLISFILLFMILVPLGMLTRSVWILLIVGLAFSGFLTAIQWLPVWIMVMLCLITALMLGSRLAGLTSRGGSDEGD